MLEYSRFPVLGWWSRYSYFDSVMIYTCSISVLFWILLLKTLLQKVEQSTLCWTSGPCGVSIRDTDFLYMWKEEKEADKFCELYLYYRYRFLYVYCCSSVAKLCPTLLSHGPQHIRFPYLLLSPGVCSNSCPLCRWCYLTISSSASHFSSCPQFSHHQGLFQCQLFTSGGQNIGASASDLQRNVQGWLPLGLTGLISLESKGLARVFSTTTWKHQFFDAQPSLCSNSRICTWTLEIP